MIRKLWWVTLALALAGCPAVNNARLPKPSPHPDATPVTAATLTGKVKLAGTVLGAAAEILHNNAGNFISDNGSALISNNGSSFISDNGSALISDGGGGFISDNGSAIISDGGNGYRLLAGTRLLAPVEHATITVTDGQGGALAAATTSDARGAYTITLDQPPAGNLYMHAAYSAGDVKVALENIVAKGATKAPINPVTSLVAKKVEALIAAGAVPATSFNADGVRQATEALVPFVSANAIAGAGIVNVAGGKGIFDVMMAKAPKLATEIRGISSRTGLPLLGQSDLGNGGPATATTLFRPVAAAYDPSGKRVVVVDRTDGRLRAIDLADPAHPISVLVGETGAVDVRLASPSDAVFDPEGHLYVADSDHRVIRRVDFADPAHPTQKVVAGQLDVSTPLATADVADATTAALSRVSGLAWDAGNKGLVFCDYFGNQVWRLDPATGALKHLAGQGDVPPPTDVFRPTGVAVGPDGTIYVAEQNDNAILALDKDGRLAKLALSGAEAALDGPRGPKIGPDGQLYVADRGHQRIARIDLADPAHPATTVAGVFDKGGTAKDGEAATAGLLTQPEGLAFDPQGHLVVCDSGNGVVRLVGDDGAMSVLAGVLASLQPGTGVRFSKVAAIVPDGHGNFLIGDTGNAVIDQLTPDGKVSLFAGTEGSKASGGDGQPATKGSFALVGGVAVDAQGRVYVGDGNGTVRRIGTDGLLSTIATGISKPGGMVCGPDGTLYVCDADEGPGRRVYAIAPDGTKSVLIGAPVGGDGQPLKGKDGAGDGGPAEKAGLSLPFQAALGPDGNLYVADLTDQRVRKVVLGDPQHPISTYVASQQLAPAQQHGPTADFANPIGIVFDPQGRLLVSDALGQRVVRIEKDGATTVIAGRGGRAINNSDIDGGLGVVTGMAFDADGSLLVADTGSNQVKRVLAAYLKD